MHNLLPHAHFRHSYTPPYIHPLADFQEFRDRFEKRHLSLFHPASFASFAQIARRLPPSALSSSAASSASSSSLHATWLFFPALPFPFYIQPAHPVGLPRHVLIATARTARVRCRAVRDCVRWSAKLPFTPKSLLRLSLYTTRVFRHATHSPSHLSHVTTQSRHTHISRGGYAHRCISRNC